MFSVFRKAMNIKIVSWGGRCYSIVLTAKEKSKFLELNCIISLEVRKKAWSHSTSDKF